MSYLLYRVRNVSFCYHSVNLMSFRWPSFSLVLNAASPFWIWSGKNVSKVLFTGTLIHALELTEPPATGDLCTCSCNLCSRLWLGLYYFSTSSWLSAGINTVWLKITFDMLLCIYSDLTPPSIYVLIYSFIQPAIILCFFIHIGGNRSRRDTQVPDSNKAQVSLTQATLLENSKEFLGQEEYIQ